MTTPQNCSSCNALVEEGELIHFAEQQVCIHCKDRYAQRLKEGLAPDDESADKLIRQLEFWRLHKIDPVFGVHDWDLPGPLHASAVTKNE